MVNVPQTPGVKTFVQPFHYITLLITQQKIRCDSQGRPRMTLSFLPFFKCSFIESLHKHACGSEHLIQARPCTGMSPRIQDYAEGIRIPASREDRNSFSVGATPILMLQVRRLRLRQMRLLLSHLAQEGANTDLQTPRSLP